MQRHGLPSIKLRVDGVVLDGVRTEIGHVGGFDLTIVTTVGPLAIDVQSSYLGGEGTPTAASHLVLAPGFRDAVAGRREPGSDVMSSRAACLLEHLAHVREGVSRATRGDVRIEVDDQSLSAAGLA